MKFFKLFEPIFATTRYEREVLQELQLLEYVKAYYKQATVATISIAIVATTWQQIQKDPFTADLVKNAGLTPVQAYFANKFTDERNFLNGKRDELGRKLESLNIDGAGGLSTFLKEKAKNPEFVASLQSDIAQSPRFIDYLAALYVQQDKEFQINSNTYKMSDLAARAKMIVADREISNDEKKELIEKMQKAIINGWKHAENEATLQAAMHALFNFERKNFFPQSKSYITPGASFTVQNYDEIMNAFFAAAIENKMVWNGIELPAQNYQTAYSTLKKAYVENTETLRQMQEANKIERQKYQAELIKVNEALAAIATMNSSNYKQTTEKVEKLIKEYK